MSNLQMDLTPETYSQAFVRLGHALVALLKPSVPRAEFCEEEESDGPDPYDEQVEQEMEQERGTGW